MEGHNKLVVMLYQKDRLLAFYGFEEDACAGNDKAT